MWRTLRPVTRFLTLVTVNCKTCDTYGGEEKCIQLGQPKIDNFENLGVNGKII